MGKLVIFIKVLALVIGLVAVTRTANNALTPAKRAKTSSKQPSTIPIGASLQMAGVDVRGIPFVPQLSSPRQKLVAFVVRSSSYAADIAFWKALEFQTHPRNELAFVGFCADRPCVALANQDQSTSFRLIGYSQVQTMERLWEADMEGAALVLSYAGTVEDMITWRGSAMQATMSRLLEVI